MVDCKKCWYWIPSQGHCQMVDSDDLLDFSVKEPTYYRLTNAEGACKEFKPITLGNRFMLALFKTIGWATKILTPRKGR